MNGIIIFIFVFILIYALSFLLFLPRIVERHLKQFQERLVERQSEEIQSTYKELRGWRHDYRNHMQVLRTYVENGDLEKTKAYMNQMDQDLSVVDQMVKTGNGMADAIVNSKLALARERQISLDTTLRIPEKLPISDMEFCVIFANLMDNAIEACMNIQKAEERFIRIYIGMFQKQFYISVSNATANTERLSSYHTRKGSEHGFGLYRIDSVVKRHEGYLNRKNEPGVFVTEIMLPLVYG